jgi:hypothetical protein
MDVSLAFLHQPPACEPAPPFRLVLPRDKRDRLTELTATLAQRRRCSMNGCTAECLPVVLVDAEREALLCPRHQLVHLDGTAVDGQPLVATAAW